MQDRYGQESEAAQLSGITQPEAKFSFGPSIPRYDKYVTLPAKPSTLDADYLLIETLQGTTIATIPFKGQRINASKLPEGVYQWRSLGKKGRNHRLGYFSIKREQTK